MTEIEEIDPQTTVADEVTPRTRKKINPIVQGFRWVFDNLHRSRKQAEERCPKLKKQWMAIWDWAKNPETQNQFMNKLVQRMDEFEVPEPEKQMKAPRPSELLALELLEKWQKHKRHLEEKRKRLAKKNEPPPIPPPLPTEVI